ncbi:d-alanyl-D-alanine carboxypeptidase [Clostridium sp. CAG:58]|uniref:D-alanyl-D-alanine carboxypeptidase family protein n=1 Tax=Alitiscatomonas sp. TaxID=2981647 RepID=UPI00033BFAAE|nr:d-alanyl-D-alanine carboxypeptidase [Clostridium sp. CAG:58]
MKYKKKILCFFLCIALMTGLFPVSAAFAAADWPTDVSISADGGILMDAGSGAILYEKNSREAYYPASITKILTALVILENCDLDETVTFSNEAVNTLEPGASILGARAGDQLSVRECLYALLLQSANEVANALAEHCSGSIDAFAELMNEKARSLGCTSSNFANPSGLNDENHYTSAYDMALISQAAFSNPTFVEIDSTTYYDVPAGKLKQYPDGWRYYAHHRMLKKNDSLYYDGVIGGKTGYTSLAGNTLVTCAERDGLKLIAVVLNGHQTHYSDTKALFDFGFRNFKSVSVAGQDSVYQDIENDLAIGGIHLGGSIRLSVGKNSAVTLPSEGDFSDVSSSLSYTLEEAAPSSAVARIDYTYGDRNVGHAYLEAVNVPAYTPDPSLLAELAESTGAISGTAGADSGLETEETEQADTPESSRADEVGPNVQEKDEKPETADSKAPEKKDRSPVISILIKGISVLAVIAVIGAAIFGFLTYRAHKERAERILRQQRREKRLKKWGYSTKEFDQIMEEHLRSKSQIKKPGLRDRWKK